MADDQSVVRQVAWQEVFPATLLFSTLRLAVNFRALLLAALAFAAMTGGWWVIGKSFSSSSDKKLHELIDAYNGLAPWSDEATAAPASTESPPAVPQGWNTWLSSSPLVTAWDLISRPFVQTLDFTLTFICFMYVLVCALWALVVWAFFGGTISRMAAVALARDEQLSFSQAISFAASKWASYFAAPLFPLLGVVVLGLPLALLGLLLHFNAGVVIAGLLWPVALGAGLCMAVLAVGLFFGWPLMWGTISTEGTDSFDALSRSYAYTYQRPLHYLLYAVVAALLGVLGWLIVSIFAAYVINLSNWGLSWGSSSDQLREVLHPGPDSSLTTTGVALVHFWIGCVETLALGFIFSYFWTATTAIYLLLRRQVDATETDEVYMPEQEETYGLPPLKQDAAGVPAPADDAAAPAGNGG